MRVRLHILWAELLETLQRRHIWRPVVLPGNRDRGSSRQRNKIVTLGKNRDLHQDEGPGPARAAQCRSEITVKLYGMSVNTKKVSNGNTPFIRLQQVKSKICMGKKCPGGGSNTRSDANCFSETSKKNFFPHCVHNIRGFVTTSRDKILSNQNHFEQ